VEDENCPAVLDVLLCLPRTHRKMAKDMGGGAGVAHRVVSALTVKNCRTVDQIVQNFKSGELMSLTVYFILPFSNQFFNKGSLNLPLTTLRVCE